MPCVNTIRKHLLALEIGCGFDGQFFELLKKKFETKTDHQKKGILVFDEIFLRQSLSVNTRSLTYLGLQDYGDGLDIKIQGSEKADHALVLMLQTLADSIHQPIAVFTSKGSVKGKYYLNILI